MKKTSLKIVVLCGILGIGLAGIAMASGALKGTEPAMMVSPSTIVLAKVSTITVHTNIPYGAVLPGSMLLNGIEPWLVFSDDCGDIVGKFAVADLVDEGLATGKAILFELTGAYINGVGFEAIDDVRVK
jgi:hypothetical protein